MDCAECERLSIEYESLEIARAAAIGELASNWVWVRADEYRRLRSRADQARLDSEVGRLSLEMHRRGHK